MLELCYYNIREREEAQTKKERKNKMLKVHVCWGAEVHEVFEVVAESIADLQKAMVELEERYEDAQVYFDGEEIIVDC